MQWQCMAMHGRHRHHMPSRSLSHFAQERERAASRSRIVLYSTSSSGVLCCRIKFRVRLVAALCPWVGIGIGTVRSGWVCCVSSIYRPEKEGWSGKSESSNATARLCDVMRVTTPDAILLSLAPLLLPEAVPTSTMSPGLIFVAGMAKPPACINTA